MPKNTAPVKATVTADEVVTRTLNIEVGKESVALVITNGVPSVARKLGTPLGRELTKAVLSAIQPAQTVETEEAPAPTRAPRATKTEEGEREVRRRAPRAEMQAARLRGEIPCLKGCDPYGVKLAELGIFNAEWSPGMPTSRDEDGTPTPDADEQDEASKTVTF